MRGVGRTWHSVQPYYKQIVITLFTQAISPSPPGLYVLRMPCPRIAKIRDRNIAMMMMTGYWNDSCTGAENHKTLRHEWCPLGTPNLDGSPVPKRPTRRRETHYV